MKVELFGLAMDAPGVTFYLWSPWRCTMVEHKLFDAVASTGGGTLEKEPDEHRYLVKDAKGWKGAVQAMSRVLKGWQEEGVDANNEKRTWRWLIEGDVDANGYDHKGEKSAFWLFARLSVDRGGPGEEEKGEDVDLNGFGICVWGTEG